MLDDIAGISIALLEVIIGDTSTAIIGIFPNTTCNSTGDCIEQGGTGCVLDKHTAWTTEARATHNEVVGR